MKKRIEIDLRFIIIIMKMGIDEQLCFMMIITQEHF